jgi:hypothetical protein
MRLLGFRRRGGFVFDEGVRDGLGLVEGDGACFEWG